MRTIFGWRLWRSLSPSQIFVGSFLLLIIVGTLGLKTIPGLYTGEPLSWLDALFTATSAICVTGLIVVDTATYFTFAGQVYLLALIQIGGLGMLVFTSTIIMLLGRKLSLRDEEVHTGAVHIIPEIAPRQLLIAILRTTFIIEAIGALLLFLTWYPTQGVEAAWPAVFHSVSAFCNAGFSTNTDSLMSHHVSPLTTSIIMVLIVIGGIGFLTLEELRVWARTRGRRPVTSTHTKLVLSATLVLILGGWVLYLVFEWDASLSELTLTDKLHNAMFMSVTARTAGFNTVDYADVSDGGNLVTIILMSIGGSPGSTAGGLKTTTFAIIVLLAWSRLRASQTTVFFNRSIPDETIQRAVGMAVVATAVVVLAMLVITYETRPHGDGYRFLHQLFEVVSAFNTVGLSAGITDDLTPSAKVTVISLMFLGRVGPLALATALIAKRKRAIRFRYAHEEVVVG
ncbi:TrkH family potassium uptake protein [Calycomorphotria hydatis]|uniref:TrkH family potassium uptake protein n=1 Tax=Calycomorphotria hydatis TaxID=2528027 RepID=UPI001E37E14F|nr:TrkH family potassium uptake protein [Calycomorphotria hydatis]